MSKAVFIQSSHSHYADRPGEVYQFPNRKLLSAAKAAVGDWIVYYEGKRGTNRGYYAAQRLDRIVDDPTTADHSLAIMDRASWIEFPNKLPHKRANGQTRELGLPASRGNNATSIRPLRDEDFNAIIDEAFAGSRSANQLARNPGFAEAQENFAVGGERARILSSRAFRDRAFARLVREAYGGRCAISGLEIRNGGGRPEVEAAHIVPVEQRGPDVLANGLALSGTLHWMFDRGLVSAEDDGTILIARGSVGAESARRLIRPEGKLLAPRQAAGQPHPAFLRWHREHCYKG